VNIHVKIAAALVVVGILIGAGFKFIWPLFEARAQIDTTDARGTKGRIAIGVDNWIGYFPLCSDEMRKRMRAAGYVLVCDDDKADYPKRFANLKSNTLQFAVATVDAYLINGPAAGFPGAIVAVIDESKGGDAIVAWKDKVASLDALKAAKVPSIAFTPGSPSEHLLRSAAVHFDVAALRGKGPWRIETNGSPEALKRLLDRKADAAVVWEPDVTRALATAGVIKLLSTAETQRLIIDVLVASRTVLQQDPEMIKTLLVTYFDVVRHYSEQPDNLASDVALETKVPMAQVKPMLAGVAWTGLTDNFEVWLGTKPNSNGMADVIRSTLRILTETGALAGDPLPDQDPYRIINSNFIGAAFTATATGMQRGADGGAARLDQHFSEMADSDWQRLREIGTLKALNVSFQSGTADLSYDGKTEIDGMMDILRHYPAFRIRVRGHTAQSGDPELNRKLSLDRAEAVARYMNVTYNVDPNRIKVIGMGSSQPLPPLPNESDRAYQYRLPRVEVSLLADAF
jgi:outer membrane protein OmpA-like peptidoglycan-associated protein